jgi:hypothetical protein
MDTPINSLKVGDQVALVLKEERAPQRCYFGVITEMDDRGLRLNLLDCHVGSPLKCSFFAPWDSIASALIAAPEQSRESFELNAAEFQLRSNYMGEGREAQEEAVREFRKKRQAGR